MMRELAGSVRAIRPHTLTGLATRGPRITPSSRCARNTPRIPSTTATREITGRLAPSPSTRPADPGAGRRVVDTTQGTTHTLPPPLTQGTTTPPPIPTVTTAATTDTVTKATTPHITTTHPTTTLTETPTTITTPPKITLTATTLMVTPTVIPTQTLMATLTVIKVTPIATLPNQDILTVATVILSTVTGDPIGSPHRTPPTTAALVAVPRIKVVTLVDIPAVIHPHRHPITPCVEISIHLSHLSITTTAAVVVVAGTIILQ